MRKQTIFLRVAIGVTFLTLMLATGKAGRAADSETDRLLDLLVQKHLLTKGEAASVRAEINKGSQDHVESASSPAQNQVAPPEHSAGIEKRAEEAASKLPFKISGYGQVQWDSLPGAGSTFQLRRGRVTVDGNVDKFASYKIQVDAVRAPSLLDAYLKLNLGRQTKMTLGQFKVPFSQENLQSSADLLTIERSQVVNSLVPGRDNGSNGRDIGADVGGSYKFNETAGVDYAVGIFNGAGVNRKDDNNRKDFAGRLAVRPFRGLALAGDYYNGAPGSKEVARDRQGAEVAYTYRPLTLLSEFIWGHDGAVREQGWYGLGAWRFSKQWEGVFRVDGFDPDRSKAGNAATTYLVGFNWYFAPGLKWQVNYGVQDKQSQTKSLFLSQLQFKF